MSSAVLKVLKILNCKQPELARRIGTNVSMVNSWINRGIQVPLEYALQMQYLTKNQVTWPEISPHLAHLKKRLEGLISLQAFALPRVQMPVSDISYDTTIPKNVDEIQVLSQDIQVNGLQHSICIDTEKRLIFGVKRLFAYKMLNRKTILCWSLSLPELFQGIYTPQALRLNFCFSELVCVGVALEKFIGKRQGQRNDQPLRHEHVEVKGRTDSFVASRLGFGSRFSYIQAKKIYLQGSSALVIALNDGRLDIAGAMYFIRVSDEEQREILCQSDKEIAQFIQKSKSLLHFKLVLEEASR